MNAHPLTPRQALNKAFLKVKPTRAEIERFKTTLVGLLDHLNPAESEEFHKNLLADFLKQAYYAPTHFINTKGRADLVIHTGKDAATPVGVLIETKKPTNTAEMPKPDHLDSKALRELVLYYLRERIAGKNLDTRHLIATNLHEWFIFDAAVFEKAFTQNAQLVKQFSEFEAGSLSGTTTDFFYEEIAKPAIAAKLDDLTFTHVVLADYDAALRNNNPADDTALIALFKLLSPQHLLKLPFANDSNSLDKGFYAELLHIIGLAETKDGSKKVIRRSAAGERHAAALLENAIIQLDAMDKLSNLHQALSGFGTLTGLSISQFGDTKEERLFNVALELAITWVNRVLFLKLLEAQLLAYHKGDPAQRFLNATRIKNFDRLNALFFQVLARQPEERNAQVKEAFANVPYLNSSLFELTELEQATLVISNLSDDETLPLHPATVLKDANGKRRTGSLPTLDYLFAFLDAYDFANDGGEAIQEENKSLINASVLGLIFEKINGYRDGSFFTPGFITMYMCRETLRRAVVQKFNERKGWQCAGFDDLYDKIEDRKEANEIVNSLKICDPAVGSGHFLVSALNELIAIKSDLRILQDRQGKRLKEYRVEVVNDELIVADEEGDLFDYRPASPESQRVQEALFHEKQTLIERCLFGVDINPNSVKICRLRLWIELLKHAYYTTTPLPGFETLAGVEGTAKPRLETLPNIDINIREGNSLISRFALDADLKVVLSRQKRSIAAYQQAVQAYREARRKEDKREIERQIAEMKGDFRTEIGRNDPKVKRLAKLSAELITLQTQGGLFELSAKEQKARKQQEEKLQAEIAALTADIEEIKQNKIYRNAFEWRFEFPEVLNDNGDFVGFDVVIGNPPYISNWDLSESNRNMVVFLEKEYQPFLSGHWDLFGCFVILAHKLSKNKGLNSFILPTSFYKEKHSTELRKFFLEHVTIIELLDFQQLVVFDDVARQTGIYLVEKSKHVENKIIIKANIFNYGDMVPQNFFLDLKNYAFKTSVSESDICLFKKITHNAILLGELVCINTGVVAHSKKESNLKFTKDDVIHKELKNGYKKYVIGSNLSPYLVIFEGDYIDYESKMEHFHRPKFPLLFESEKIIVRRISGKNNRIIACYDYSGYYSNDNLMHLVKWNQNILSFQKPEKKWNIIESTISLKYLTAILNSQLCTYFFSKFLSTDTLQGSYSSIYPEDIRQIPIKRDEDKEKAIIELVNLIISAKQRDPAADTSALEAKIDRLVYALYGLTPEDIAIVEGRQP